MSPNFVGKSLPLSSSGLANVTEDLKVKAAEIWSVLHVETAGYGFLADRRPKILFELHVFSDQTNQPFDPAGIGPDYGADGAHQYERLAKAITFDEQAALRSASWGLGQIMGFNAKDAGFPDGVNQMITAMIESEE